MKLVYIAGPYGAKTAEAEDPDAAIAKSGLQIELNIRHARREAIRLWEAGYAVICPHLNTARMELDCKLDHAGYLAGDFEIIRRCDALVMLRGWETSKGSAMEKAHAESLAIPVFYEGDLP